MSAPLVALVDGRQAPLLARPYFVDGDPGPIIATLAQVPELLGPAAAFLGRCSGPRPSHQDQGDRRPADLGPGLVPLLRGCPHGGGP